MKRLIVTLLTVCMVVGMFAGLGVTAFADYDTSDMVPYTMTAGDNVYNVCQKMGISFWDYENVIKTVNNIKSYSNISIGAVIYFPKPGAAATLPAGTGATAGSTSTAGSTTPSTDSFEVKGDDKIAYYLVPHVMQNGEIIKDLCTAYGVDYYSYAAKIAKMNGLASCDNVKAGATVLIPSISAPSGECYRVIAHTVQQGDTVYNKCIEYGVNYYSSLTVLKGVNNTDNLNNIKAKSTLYIPVAGNASGSAGSGTGSTTPSTGVVYNITIASVANGKVSANVNGAAVVKAASGSAVSIVATPDKGYALESFTVAATSGGATVLSTDDGFTMPAFAVTVTAKFRQASSYKATANAAQHGTIKLQPAGGTAAQTQQITEGSKVTVVATPDKGYELDTITVVNPNNTKKTVAVNENCFIMPAHPVSVTATFVSATKYSCFVSNDVKNGTYWIEVDGSKTDKVNVGKTVSVCVDPDDGYEIQDIYYYQTTNNTNGVDLATKQSFAMPAYDVTVVVVFQKGSEHTVTIDSAISNGTVVSNVDKAVCGETVSLTVTPASGCKLDEITVTDANGAKVSVNADNTFTMPSTNVTVSATFSLGKYNVTVNTDSGITAKLLINGAEATKNPAKANINDQIIVKLSPKPGYVGKVVATNANGNKKYDVAYDSTNDWYYLTGNMPGNAVVINASYEVPTYDVFGPYKTGSGEAKLLKDGAALDPAKAAKGDIVTISLEAAGSVVKSVKVVNPSTSAENAVVTKVNDLTYTFKMPAEPVNVLVEFSAPEAKTVTLDALSGGSISFVVDGYPVASGSNVVVGAKVEMVITPDDGKELKTLQVVNSSDSNKVVTISNNSFTMPEYDVKVSATFADVKATAYKISKGSTPNGKFLVLANSSDTKDTLSAAKGTRMLVKVTPNKGYAVDQIVITYNNGLSQVASTNVDINIWEFYMVDSNVNISITYKAA